ncbi:hypothetical protein ACGFIR_00690 [Micromonospora sp. NPDC049051]|uniref:hypothetical protein n=1 Tax=unclassified Micromonospora TaxID=2617518 RepID=UPI003712F833
MRRLLPSIFVLILGAAGVVAGVTSPLWGHVRKAGTQQHSYVSESFLRSNGWILPRPPASYQC